MTCVTDEQRPRTTDIFDINDRIAAFLAFLLLLLFIAFGIGTLVTMDNDTDKQIKDNDLSCNPRVYVQDLYVPALLNHNNKVVPSSLNSSLIIGLEFYREAASPGALAAYSGLNLNLYYGEGPSYPVANRTVPSFRMGDRRIVNYTAVVEAPRLPWEDAFNKVSGGSAVLLRLELFGKFKDMYSGSSFGRCKFVWSELQVEAQVWVNASAHMLSNTPILFT